MGTSTKELLVKTADKCSKLDIYFKASHQEGAEVLVLSVFKFYYSTGKNILMDYSMAFLSIFPAQLGWNSLHNTNTVMILCMKKWGLIFVQNLVFFLSIYAIILSSVNNWV